MRNIREVPGKLFREFVQGYVRQFDEPPDGPYVGATAEGVVLTLGKRAWGEPWEEVAVLGVWSTEWLLTWERIRKFVGDDPLITVQAGPRSLQPMVWEPGKGVRMREDAWIYYPRPNHSTLSLTLPQASVIGKLISRAAELAQDSRFDLTEFWEADKRAEWRAATESSVRR